MASLLSIAFEVILAAIAVFLLLAYVSFARMNPDVLRARMWLMAARVQRFLLAFTLGFLAIVVTFLVTFAGVALPVALSTGSVFFFLGAVLYGCLEILFVARPDLVARGRAIRRTNGRGSA